ncbi:hypothetical protein [Streptomyces sp. 142MFCol3.1]|uniref:hypothetical protein n=1 Tax=Streptomyces sp. 142MFCol3.1 TaxID=1172179 RepID=UPI00040504F3|nr:hypothetical protein [Streptomyces sp. 142MFCol3.1]
MEQEPYDSRAGSARPGTDGAAPDRGPVPGETTVITATDVAGSRFTGGTGTAPEPGRQAAVVAQARAVLPMVVQSLYAEQLRSVELRGDDTGDSHFVLTDHRGMELTLRVDAVPLPTGTVARMHVNTTSDHHFVQLSDRMDPQQVGRALSHELGEMLAVRERAARAAAGDPSVAGLAPPREVLLTRGRLTAAEEGFRLTEEDLGRVGELNHLAARMTDATLDTAQRAEAREELSALIDHTGLRPQAPSGSEQFDRELQAADLRLNSIEPHLTPQAWQAMSHLAVPAEQLSGQDAADLQAFRARAAYTLPLGNGPPMPGMRPDGTPVPREELAAAAAEAADRRTRASAATLDQLRAEAAASGEWPTRQVMIGGGASLVGRDPDALLVDARGRWHLDPGQGIVQSADQVRDMRATGLGDAHQFVDPTGRVPRDAVRLWEDELAVRGPVVDGTARLLPAQDGRLYAHIRPGDGSPDVYVQVEGVPTVATGLPPEMVPGVDRRDVVNLPEAIGAVRGQLPAGSPVHERLAGAPDARQTLQVLREEGVLDTLRADAGARSALQTLDATARWEQARAAAPGRVFLGDEIAENRFDVSATDAPRTWLVAGAGGTGVADAEIILEADPQARVTIYGPNLPPALENQVQFTAMRERFVAEYGGDGRLTIDIHPGNRVGAVQMHTGPDGKPRFREGHVEAEAYVASLGRTAPVPQALRDMGEQTRAAGGKVRGDLMFDHDRQYLGYGMTFESGGQQRRVEVTGAASQALPRDVFPRETQAELGAMAARQVPSQSGNAAPGFAPTAQQSVRLAQAREQGTVERHTAVPESWLRPAVAAGTPPASGPSAGPSSTAPAGAPSANPVAGAPSANPVAGAPSANPVAGAARRQSGRGSAAPVGPVPGSAPGPASPGQPPRVQRPPQPGGGGGAPGR